MAQQKLRARMCAYSKVDPGFGFTLRVYGFQELPDTCCITHPSPTD